MKKEKKMENKPAAAEPKFRVADLAVMYGFSDYKIRVFCMRAEVSAEELVTKIQFERLLKKVYGVIPKI